MQTFLRPLCRGDCSQPPPHSHCVYMGVCVCVMRVVAHKMHPTEPEPKAARRLSAGKGPDGGKEQHSQKARVRCRVWKQKYWHATSNLCFSSWKKKNIMLNSKIYSFTQNNTINNTMLLQTEKYLKDLKFLIYLSTLDIYVFESIFNLSKHYVVVCSLGSLSLVFKVRTCVKGKGSSFKRQAMI